MSTSWWNGLVNKNRIKRINTIVVWIGVVLIVAGLVNASPATPETLPETDSASAGAEPSYITVDWSAFGTIIYRDDGRFVLLRQKGDILIRTGSVLESCLMAAKLIREKKHTEAVVLLELTMDRKLDIVSAFDLENIEHKNLAAEEGVSIVVTGLRRAYIDLYDHLKGAADSKSKVELAHLCVRVSVYIAQASNVKLGASAEGATLILVASAFLEESLIESGQEDDARQVAEARKKLLAIYREQHPPIKRYLEAMTALYETIHESGVSSGELTKMEDNLSGIHIIVTPLLKKDWPDAIDEFAANMPVKQQ